MMNTTTNTTNQKMEIISKIDNISLAIGQGASVALSVHGALHSEGEGGDYVLALLLAANLLDEQVDKLQALMKDIRMVGGCR